MEIHAEHVGGETTLRGGCKAFLECEVQAMALPRDPRVGKQDVNALLIDVDHFRSPAAAQLSDDSAELAMP